MSGCRGFTAEELAELAAFDAEVDLEPDWDAEEVAAAARRDREFRQERMDFREKAIADYQRAYREANREAIADYQRAYYAANREAIAERKRAYYAKGSSETAEASVLRRWRKERGLSQQAAARTLGCNQSSISYWERGVAPLPDWVRKEIESQ